MNWNRSGFLATLFAFVMVATGCGDSTTSTAGETTGGGTTTASGTTGGGGAASGKLTIEGSDTLEPLSKKWQEAFGAKNAGTEITVSAGGSGRGITSLINGTCDIANASRKAEEKEMTEAKGKNVTLVATPVARDGITIIVNPSNTIKSLTVAQLSGIYTGKVKNWREVGGENMVITVSGRNTASGTYKYFQEDVMKKGKYRQDMKNEGANNAIATNVSAEKGGIGYIGVAYAEEFTKVGKVREVPVSFDAGKVAVMPTSANILAGNYPISRELYCYTNGEPKGLTKTFLEYATSEEGQKIVKEAGYVTLK